MGQGPLFILVGQGPLFIWCLTPRPLTCHQACGISSATLTASCHFALTWVSRASDSGGRDTFDSVCVGCRHLTRPRHRSNRLRYSRSTTRCHGLVLKLVGIPPLLRRSLCRSGSLQQLLCADVVRGGRRGPNGACWTGGDQSRRRNTHRDPCNLMHCLASTRREGHVPGTRHVYRISVAKISESLSAILFCRIS